MMPGEAMRAYVREANQAVSRWGGTVSVPADADDARAASMIRSAFVSAAEKAAEAKVGPYYPDDHSWHHGGILGLSRAEIEEEMAIAADSMAAAPESWGIAARIEVGDASFDVPIAKDLDPGAAANILERMRGRETRYVDVDAIAAVFPDVGAIGITLWADNWGQMRDVGSRGALSMDVAMDFRRPVVWDLLRAELSELPPEPLPEFTSEGFYARYAMASRYDATLMRSTRSMVKAVARSKCEPATPAWAEWFPTVTNMLGLIGVAPAMDGISIILNFLVEEPVLGSPGEWRPVGYHNVAVCYGLHPLAAVRLLELVLENADVFHDLPDADDLRYVVKGASAIQDSMLSALRVSLTGRTGAYDALVASERPVDPAAEAVEEDDALPF